MLPRFLWLSALAVIFQFLVGCSTPESQERLDTALCWLRPSCLPSQQSPAATDPRLPTASKRLPAPATSKQTHKTSRQRQTTRTCSTSVKVTIQSSRPYIMISYVEPTTKANGQALTNLAKTTIYHDLGKGLVKYKDIPATNPQGGGTIQEKISLAISEGESIQATFCVTATDTNGREG